MLGNGVKRKLDEDEDGLETGKAPPEAEGASSRTSYTLRRQTVLNISLMKLYGPRTPAEPCLRRRVLVNNMIRRIHDEFKEEGGLRALFFPVPPAGAAGAAMEEDEGYHEAPPGSFGVLSSSLAPLDSCLTPASLLEDDTPLFFALPSPPPSSPRPPGLHASPRPPPSPSPKDSFSSALEEIEELCPTSVTTTSTTSSSSSSSSLSSERQTAQAPPSASASSGTDVKDGARAPSLRDRESLSQEASGAAKTGGAAFPPAGTDTSPTPPPQGAFLTDFALDDILFTDIDTSMYDFNPGSSASNSGASKMASVVTTDDLVKTISTFGGGGGGGSSPSSLSQNQPFKMDLAELDHIMEVLVGS